MKARELLSALGIVLVLGTAALATVISGTNTAIRGTSSVSIGDPNSKLFNFITDAGAKCNGVADDGPALSQAGVMMRAAQTATPTIGVTLFVPPNVTCQWLTCPAGSDGFRPFFGLTNFTFIATGATIFGGPSSCVTYSGTVIPGADGSGPVVQHKFVPNLVGDTCVTMVNSGDETTYPVGRWVLVAGQGMQLNSFPPNFAYWEYQQVASTPTGKVCFKGSMKNAYVDSTHVIDLSPVALGGGGGNCSNVTCGGQGTLILMSPAWGTTLHFKGGTWLFQNEVQFEAQNIIIENITWTGGGQNCYLPSLTQSVTYINNNAGTCTAEMDKEVDTITVNGGTLNGNFQSASINTLTLNAGAKYAGSLPLTTNCNNSSIINGSAIKFGQSFGSLRTFFNGVNCTFPDFDTAPAFANAVQVLPSSGIGGNFSYNGLGQFQSVGNDIYAGNPFYPTWISRGGHMHFACCSGNSRDYNNHITIGDSQNVVLTSTSATTTIAISPSPGGTLPAPTTGTLSYEIHVYPIVTCSGCVGTPTFTGNGRMAADFNQALAQNQQAFTYLKRTYTCANNIPNVAGSYDINASPSDKATLAGTLTSLKVNVTVADTNPSDSGGATVSSAAPIFNTSTGVETAGVPTYALVNLLNTGLRTVNLTTSLGALTGDTLTPPGANAWIQGQFNNTAPAFTLTGVTNGLAAQCPVVTIEWITSD